jgi:hypothetical protein
MPMSTARNTTRASQRSHAKPASRHRVSGDAQSQYESMRADRGAARYSHVRMEAKRRALDEIAARQRAVDEKRKVDVERRERVAIAPESAVVQ